MPVIHSERGFALPLTILVITVMTMLLTSAHVRVRADRIIAESSGATVDAFAVAQSGLHRYFAYYDSLKVRPPDGDSLRINVPNGYADVRAYKVQSPTDTMEPEVYIVRSTGVLIQPTRGSDPQAQRTVAQFAQWQSAAMKLSGGVVGAFTAANGLTVNTSGTLEVSGHDHCASPAPSIPGVRVTKKDAPDENDFNDLQGSPPLEDKDNGKKLAEETAINWPAIVGGRFDTDYDSFVPGWSYPTMLIYDDYSINNGVGSGLLIVTGNLTLTGVIFNFRGVILVGGRLITNTMFTTIRGVTVTGLNEQLGMNPPVGRLGGGWSQDYLYYECEVRNALNALVGFVPIQNAWIDNWAMY